MSQIKQFRSAFTGTGMGMGTGFASSATVSNTEAEYDNLIREKQREIQELVNTRNRIEKEKGKASSTATNKNKKFGVLAFRQLVYSATNKLS